MFSNLFAVSSTPKLKRRQVYFNASNKQFICDALENKHFSDLSKITVSDYGALMKINASRDKNYISIQLFDYIPYQYEPGSKLYEFLGDDARNICEILKKHL